MNSISAKTAPTFDCVMSVSLSDIVVVHAILNLDMFATSWRGHKSYIFSCQCSDGS